MISATVLGKFEKAETLLTQNAYAEAERILDSVQQATVLGTADLLQFWGRLAQGYRRVGRVEKELPVLEKLCALAVSDLARLGRLATHTNIQATAADLAYLAWAYRKVGNYGASKTKFEEANALFSKVGLEIDPDYERKHPYRIALRRKQ